MRALRGVYLSHVIIPLIRGRKDKSDIGPTGPNEMSDSSRFLVKDENNL